MVRVSGTSPATPMIICLLYRSVGVVTRWPPVGLVVFSTSTTGLRWTPRGSRKEASNQQWIFLVIYS
jgi:hypothetical protein